MFEICCQKNSILYLPTGSGKTLIALKVINHYRQILKTPLNEGGKRSVFLVNTVCLANQQAQTIEDILEVNVACWTSESKKKSWKREKFREEFEKSEVIVATSQLFLDAVKHSFISLAELNILVIDECHHARADHPTHEIMKQFQYIDAEKHPRIIGLSGMLSGISSSVNVDNVEDELSALEATMNAKIVTVRKIQDYLNVLLHSTNPNEFYIRYNHNDQETSDMKSLKDDLLKKIDEIRWELSFVEINGMKEINPSSLNPSKSRRLKEISLFFEHVKVDLKSMGLFAAYLSINSVKVQFGLIKKKPNQKQEFLKQVDRCIEYTNNLLAMMKEAQFDDDLSAEKILTYSSQHVRKFITFLKKEFTSPQRIEDLQSLVFVNHRHTAKILYHLLKKYAKYDQDFSIIADFVVGINAEIPESITEVDCRNNNKEALVKFRNKQTNVITTTSVLEEGMDLQMCNLVIMFDYPTTFRSYIQTKGRARVKNSNYVVLLENQKVDSFLEKQKKYNELDIKMKKILLTKVCDGEISQEDIEKERAEIWEPYFTHKKAVVNNLSSVSLLNRVISPYANVNGLWQKQSIGNGNFLVILTLPMSLGFKTPIVSDAFPDIKTAKQNAAFKACEILHQKGYLDHNLLPARES